MDWGLLAGGVSKGINDAFTGANQGLVQGEGIRVGRASEALQGQHLGLQQQTLQSHLAQQQVQNDLAREHLGLSRAQLDQSKAYHDSILGIHGGELAVKRALAPSQIAQHEAQARAYDSLPKYRETMATERGRGNDIREQHYADMAMSADQRNAIMENRLKAWIAKSPTMSPYARAQAAQIQSRLRDMRQQFAIASHREESGLPLAPGMKPIRQLLIEQTALEDEYQQLVGQQPGAPAGAQPGADPADPLAAMRKKWLGK